jgi:tetratricopeptide (TPR) repeat protein
MWKRALAGFEALKSDHPDIQQNLGVLHYKRGQLEEAENMWKQALTGYEKALEPDHLDILRVLGSLGLLYHERGQVEEAENTWKRAQGVGVRSPRYTSNSAEAGLGPL